MGSSEAPARLADARLLRATTRPSVRILGLAAVLAIAAVGLGARSALLQADLDRAGARMSTLEARLGGQDAVVATAMNPAHVAVALRAEALAPAAAAMVMFVPGTRQAYLVADQLPATPAGQAYQLWYADAAGVHPLQVVAFDGHGVFVAPLGVDLASASAVMITLEGAGGATGSPGPQVVFGEL